MPTTASYYRQELGHRLDAERFTYRLIQALGPESYKPEEWKHNILQRMKNEQAERIFRGSLSRLLFDAIDPQETKSCLRSFQL